MCVVVERKFKTKFTIRKRRKKRRKRKRKINSNSNNISNNSNNNNCNKLSTTQTILNCNISTNKLSESKISTFGATKRRQKESESGTQG